MKGLLVACLASGCSVVAMTLGLRIIGDQARAAINLWAYVIASVAFVVVMMATPADLGFLPPALVESNAWLDGFVGLLVFSASFLGGWIQLFTLTDRGYSLRILIDVLEAPQRRLSPEEALHAYSGGRGLVFMYDKRVGGLLDGGMIDVDGSDIRLTERGAKAAALFGRLRSLYRIGQRYD